MRVVLLVLVPFFVVSCGKIQERSPWPARIASMDGMSEAEQAEVRSAVSSLNALAKKEVIFFEGQSEDFFSIRLQKAEPTAENPQRAGYATVEASRCSVDLSSILFRTDMKDYIRSVVLHELGHCAGLEHSPDEKDIMYRITAPSSQYSQEAIGRFIEQFREAAGL